MLYKKFVIAPIDKDSGNLPMYAKGTTLKLTLNVV